MTPEFAKDFITFQKSLKPLKRNVTGDDGKPYADLASILAYVRPRLAKHNMFVVQSEGLDSVTTQVWHASSDDHIVTTARPIFDANNFESRYGRRHSLMCALGLVEEPIDSKVPTFQTEPDREVYEIVDGMREPERTDVLNAIAPLSTAQKLVIFRRTCKPVEIIAEAQKLEGQK